MSWLLAVFAVLFGLGLGTPAIEARPLLPDASASSAIVTAHDATADHALSPAAEGAPASGGEPAVTGSGESPLETVALLPTLSAPAVQRLGASVPRPPASAIAGPPYLGGLLRPPCSASLIG